MLTLIGKKYSKETQAVITLLKDSKLDFEYIDLEVDKKKAPAYIQWIKANKIITIPVLKKGEYYYCGSNQERIRTFLSETNTTGNK